MELGGGGGEVGKGRPKLEVFIALSLLISVLCPISEGYYYSQLAFFASLVLKNCLHSIVSLRPVPLASIYPSFLYTFWHIVWKW